MKRTVELNDFEKRTLACAMYIVSELFDNIPENYDLANSETGECIAKDELPRMIGILHGLGNVEKWDVLG